MEIRQAQSQSLPVFNIDAGQGVAAEILVQPTEIAFNDSPLAAVLPPGLGSTRGFVIYNLGAVNLTLAASSFEIRDAGGAISPDFILQDAAGVALPVRDQILPAGGFLALSALFRPQTVGDKNAIVRVDYSGGFAKNVCEAPLLFQHYIDTV